MVRAEFEKILLGVTTGSCVSFNMSNCVYRVILSTENIIQAAVFRFSAENFHLRSLIFKSTQVEDQFF